ncbi:MAG: PD-(D/E)XK nuclease family protein [Acidobacteria bacterium]|nr:PD-(D/E)XK nuclease family protein [Acidobacteriota bacterium]
MAQLDLFVSPSATERLARAGTAVRACAPGSRVLIVGASRGAADDLARSAAAAVRATFGIQRLSLTQAAARTALVALASGQMTPSSRLGAEAVAARAVFDAVQSSALRYFGPVATMPGFARALARTLQELRLAGIAGAALAPLPRAGSDLAWLLERFDACFAEASSVDRAALFRTAAAVLGAAGLPRLNHGRGEPRPAYDGVILLDVAVEHLAEREFVAALVSHAGRALATVPHGDADTLGHLRGLPAARIESSADGGSTDLARLRRYLFATDEEPPQHDALDGTVQLFSAPGEGREAVEIARRILAESRRGVRFDEMAVVVRSPASYFGLLEHALGRAGVPAWFDRGTRRPHPAGRAFLALLACAAEQLSAVRFAEYLSLGQVPDIGDDGGGSAAPELRARRDLPYVHSGDEAFGLPDSAQPLSDERNISESAEPENQEPKDPGSPIPEPVLIAPWRWEHLLVEAAVIGRDAARWRRRLAGKAAELDRQIAEAAGEHGTDSGRVDGLRRMRDQLEHLRRFALPIIEELAAWPRAATWGAWLDDFTRLAPRVLRTPAHVLRILADLRPMAEIGPIDLDEARRVLADRLLMLESEPPARRFGRVFVGSPQQARGRSFRVVFVPGMAERMFPQKPLEDPLLLDELRTSADASLRTQPHRLAGERLLLHLAVGAASERLYVSYPRIELAEGRARVPSFYALDVVRAATGRIPDYEWLEERARDAGNATLAWPAPPRPDEAIDDLEHDLAVLRRLLDERDRNLVKGHAHYLLKLNECLRRSVIDRWARGEARWSVSDGLIRVADDTRAMLASQRLTARPYSLSALQRFSACPYQFLLAAVYRLQPLEQPEPLQRMDPLTRGSLFHGMQAEFLRMLDAQGRLPVTEATLDGVRAVLDQVVDTVAARAYDELAPAVDRVWEDEIASIRRDLHGWLPYLARDGGEWHPRHFEFAFGEVPGERDVHSIRDEVTIEGGFRLRGAVDLIEEHRAMGTLRVTDHKTGRRPEKLDTVIVGGGAVLQPVLYGMAVEAALGRPVSIGRLFYCTAAGSYTDHPIPVNDRTRAAGLEVLQVIDRAIETGFVAAAPTEEACGRCDFRPVCGADVFRRVSRKPQDRLADLAALRSRP